MKKYTCKQCGYVYEYCRGCLLSPIPYKENGFCSKTCENTFKNKQKEVISTRDVEVVIKYDKDMTIS